MLYGVGHISSLSMLEIPDRGIVKERSSVQHHGGNPSRDFGLVVSPPLCDNSFAGGSHLEDLGLFAPPLSLGLLGWRCPSLVHYLIPLLVSFPLFISGLRLEGLSRGKGKGFGMDCLLRRVASGVGFHQLLEACPCPML